MTDVGEKAAECTKQQRVLQIHLLSYISTLRGGRKGEAKGGLGLQAKMHNQGMR